MSTPEICSDCGRTYGASWGDVSGTCGCKIRKRMKQAEDDEDRRKLEEENKELKETIKQLEYQLVKFAPPSFIGQYL